METWLLRKCALPYIVAADPNVVFVRGPLNGLPAQPLLVQLGS